MQRWFGKLQPESVRSSMLALSATAIGGGVLSLPYVCKLCGLVLGLFLLISGFIATLWSFTLIIQADIKSGGHKSFKDFCLKCGGPKLLKGYEYIAMFYLYGSLVGYQIIISNLIQGVLTQLDVYDPAQYRLYHIVAISAFTFPLCLLKSVNSLRYATFVSIGAICYTAILLIIQMPYFWEKPAKLVLFKLDWNFFNAFGITFFAFTCQAGFYGALDKLKKRDEDHKTKVAFRSCIINFVFYLMIILSGYLSSFDDTPDIIIYRKLPESIADSFKIPVMLAQIAIACALIVAIPLNFVPLRTAIYNQIFGDSEYQFKRALITAVIFSITSGTLAYALPKINVVLSVLGGIGCTMICFIVPTVAYLTVNHDRKTQSIISIVICSILVAIGIGSATNAVFKMLGL